MVAPDTDFGTLDEKAKYSLSVVERHVTAAQPASMGCLPASSDCRDMRGETFYRSSVALLVCVSEASL